MPAINCAIVCGTRSHLSSWQFGLCHDAKEIAAGVFQLLIWRVKIEMNPAAVGGMMIA